MGASVTSSVGASVISSSVGSGVGAARWAGARTRPRRASGAPVDPALADRARVALGRVTGADVRVAAGRLEIAFDDEIRLEEIVEALERVGQLLAADGAS